MVWDNPNLLPTAFQKVSSPMAKHSKGMQKEPKKLAWLGSFTKKARIRIQIVISPSLTSSAYNRDCTNQTYHHYLYISNSMTSEKVMMPVSKSRKVKTHYQSNYRKKSFVTVVRIGIVDVNVDHPLQWNWWWVTHMVWRLKNNSWICINGDRNHRYCIIWQHLGKNCSSKTECKS